jgi:hypothetical protein
VKRLRRELSYRIYLIRKWMGHGHTCDYTDPETGEYIGLCYLPGLHRGRD